MAHDAKTARLLVLHSLAEAGRPLTNQELVQMTGEPAHKVNRILYAAREEAAPLIQMQDDGHVFIGNKESLDPLPASVKVTSSKPKKTTPKKAPAKTGGEKAPAKSTAGKGSKAKAGSDLDLRIASILHGNKKPLMESQLSLQLNVKAKDLESAMDRLVEGGFVNKTLLEDFQENVYTGTKTIAQLLKTTDTPAPKEEKKAAAKKDEPAPAPAPKKEPSTPPASAASATPDLDEAILNVVADKGLMSESGIGRALAGKVGAYGRPKIMKRVLELAEENQLKAHNLAAGIRFSQPGLSEKEARANQASSKAAAKAVTPTPAKQPAQAAEPKAEPAKAPAKPSTEPTPAPTATPTLEAAPAPAAEAEESAPTPAATVTPDVLDMAEVQSLIAELQNASQHPGNANAVERINEVFGSVAGYIQHLEDENKKWRQLAGMFASNMKEVFKP